MESINYFRVLLFARFSMLSWLQLKKSKKFPTTSIDFFSLYKITFERLKEPDRTLIADIYPKALLTFNSKK